MTLIARSGGTHMKLTTPKNKEPEHNFLRKRLECLLESLHDTKTKARQQAPEAEP